MSWSLMELLIIPGMDSSDRLHKLYEESKQRMKEMEPYTWTIKPLSSKSSSDSDNSNSR